MSASQPPNRPPAVPRPSAGSGQLGAKLERAAREQRPPAFQGKAWVVVVVFALAAGGFVVSWLTGGTASPLAQAVRDTYTQQQGGQVPSDGTGARALPRGPGTLAAQGPERAEPAAEEPPPAPPGPAATSGNGPVPAALPSTQATIVAPGAGALALAAQRAPAKERPALRQVALLAFAELAAQPPHRRQALEAALRLAPDAMPEEAGLWQAVTTAALASLDTPAEAPLGVLYLGQLFDRGGEPGLRALERLVDDERRPLELRVGAARALPSARRAPLAARIGSRRDAHPALVQALR